MHKSQLASDRTSCRSPLANELKRLWRADTVLIERSATEASLLSELVREDAGNRAYRHVPRHQQGGAP